MLIKNNGLMDSSYQVQMIFHDATVLPTEIRNYHIRGAFDWAVFPRVNKVCIIATITEV